MNAIVHTAPGRLEWKQLPKPEPGPGQVRIRTAACGICATDLQMVAGWSRTSCPAIPGHEWSGIVDAVGAGGDATLAGKPCVAENVLSDGGEVGFEHPGGYAQYLITEARNVQRLPERFPLDVATLIEPLAVCMRGWSRLYMRDTRRALIIGDGPVGLLMLILMRHQGVQELGLVGGRPARLELAKELGAAWTFNYHEIHTGLADEISRMFAPAFPNVVEASGSAAAAEAAVTLTAAGGKALMIGDYGNAQAGFHWNRLLLHELELIGSNASAGAWPEAVRLAAAKDIPLQRLITHRFRADQFSEAINVVRTSRSAVKVVLQWPEVKLTAASRGAS